MGDILSEIADKVTTPRIKHYLNVFLCHFREKTGLSEVHVGSFSHALPYFRRAEQADVDAALAIYTAEASAMGASLVTVPARYDPYGRLISPEVKAWPSQVTLILGQPLAIGDWLIAGALENDALTLVKTVLAAFGTESIDSLGLIPKTVANATNGELKWKEAGFIFTFDGEIRYLTGVEEAVAIGTILTAISALIKIAKALLDDAQGLAADAKQAIGIKPKGDASPETPPAGVPEPMTISPMFVIAAAAILAKS